VKAVTNSFHHTILFSKLQQKAPATHISVIQLPTSFKDNFLKAKA